MQLPAPSTSKNYPYQLLQLLLGEPENLLSPFVTTGATVAHIKILFCIPIPLQCFKKKNNQKC